jgi:DNA-binding transcriptional regulator YdaS (Cro superfamily)
MDTQPSVSPNPVCAAVARAIAIKQSQHKLARACGVSQALISKAKIDGRLSARLAIAIHRATDGVVPGSALRPDLWRSPEHVPLEHDPEKWAPVFGKRSCSSKKIERDDDSKKSHPALDDTAGDAS